MENFNALLTLSELKTLYSGKPVGICPLYNGVLDITKTFEATGNPITIPEYKSLVKLTTKFSPKQAGSGDPSPENVRPISGWDEVVVKLLGKNLVNVNNGNIISTTPKGFVVTKGPYPLDKEYTYIGVSANGYWDPNNISYYEISENGNVTITTDATGYGIGFNVRCVPNTTYHIKNADSCLMSISYLDNEGFLLSYNGDATNKSFNTPENCYNLIVVLRPFDYNETIYKETQLELGSTPTPYEPYQPGTTATITLPEIVYGGTVDAVMGEGSKTWGFIASYNGEALPGEWISDRDVYASGTTPTTGAQVAYKLATPIPFKASQFSIPSLRGKNYIFTNGENMDIIYNETSFWG